MNRVLRAEWVKLRTMPSSGWLLLAFATAIVALGAAVTSTVDASQCRSPTECFEDTTRLSLTGVWVGQVAAVVVGALAITNEYGTGMIHTTLTAIPQRGRLLAGKAAVVVGTALLAATIGVLASLLAARNILPGNGFSAANGYPLLSLADEPTLRAAAGTVAYLGLLAVLGLGIGTMIRDSAAAIIATLTLLFGAPLVAFMISDPVWVERLERYSPLSAGLAVQATRDLDSLPIGPLAGLGVTAAYAVAAYVAALVVLRLRDA